MPELAGDGPTQSLAQLFLQFLILSFLCVFFLTVHRRTPAAFFLQGITAIYGLVVSVLISNSLGDPRPYGLFKGFLDLGAVRERN